MAKLIGEDLLARNFIQNEASAEDYQAVRVSLPHPWLQGLYRRQHACKALLDLDNAICLLSKLLW